MLSQHLLRESRGTFAVGKRIPNALSKSPQRFAMIQILKNPQGSARNKSQGSARYECMISLEIRHSSNLKDQLVTNPGSPQRSAIFQILKISRNQLVYDPRSLQRFPTREAFRDIYIEVAREIAHVGPSGLVGSAHSLSAHLRSAVENSLCKVALCAPARLAD
ncbi:hypothetical protein SLEP1_g34236 [Rubroshorea leprosula]|uniref:Uncharacterized protein n=1 Tax=Rubroshorea leprosula TaxID=152421 RepID=A0AAV5KJ80_9ROSI|nr:hypothetical protein SLEP1_g34236 [Rubroshorea leprosula]